MRRILRSAFVYALVLFSVPLLAQAPSAAPIANPGFEEGETGQPPPGWIVREPVLQAGYTVKVVEDHPETGRSCLELALAGAKKDPQAFGNVMQSLDAAPFRGQRVRFSAAARIEGGPDDQSQLWMRVDRESGQPGFFDNMGDRPIRSSTWARYQITGEVTADAKTIYVGYLLPRGGRAWLDDTAFEVLGDSGAGNEPPRPLTDRGLENLAAFARLFGVVRFFHPSDQAAAASWDSIALAGVQRVENAAGPEELARLLEGFFRPWAPTVQVYPTGHRPPEPAGLAKPAGSAVRRVGWRHLGVQLTPGPSVYRSERVDDQGSSFDKPALVLQAIDGAPFRGKRIRFRAAVRAELPAGQHAGLALRAYGAGEKELLAKETTDHPPSSEWTFADIQGDVPADAEAISVGLVLDRRGKVWIDDAALGVVDGPTADSERVVNSSLETGDDGFQPDAWDLDFAAEAAGFSWTRSSERPHSGRFSGLLASADPRTLVTAQPDEPWTGDLGGGVSAAVPLALWADAEGTLPHTAASVQSPAAAKPEGFVPSGDDRTTRLADVALAWNVFQHFYPYFDVVDTDWPAVLRSSLREAATAPDAAAFESTLRRLVAALHDGHGRAAAMSSGVRATPALTWNWIDDRLIVTWSDPEKAGGIRAGDEVLSLDARPARQALEAAETLISGATPQWRRVRALNELLLGAPNQEVRLEAQRREGPPRAVTVQRVLPSYGPGSAAEAWQKTLPEKIAEVRPGIFYVDLSRVTDDDFKGAVDKLAAAHGVVFDLRGYPRSISPVFLQHLSDKPLHSAQWQVPVLTRPDRERVSWRLSHWTLAPLAPRLAGKIAFLTGGGAISYAESCMGIVEAYKLGEIVGAPTAGTNGNVNPFTLPGGYQLVWTGMRVLKHDGSRHHGVGIQPTVPVSPTRGGVAAGRDEVLERGIAVVSW